MNTIEELADSIDCERRVRAARMGNAERLVEGWRLWHESLEWMKAGVRHRHPDADDAEVMRLANEQLERIRQATEAGIDRPIEDPR
ncbi:MAG: hypothetical protein KF861_09055 [Planctomycetaceae bacterium]|nr:hypothetical protein [Planctomycetaceae bacterium]